MTKESDRRRTDTDAAPDHISERFAQALGGLLHASRRLPVCDRTAKLHAALNGLTNADDQAAACEAARRLLAESELALEEDPWFLFHRAASEAEAALCRAA